MQKSIISKSKGNYDIQLICGKIAEVCLKARWNIEDLFDEVTQKKQYLDYWSFTYLITNILMLQFSENDLQQYYELFDANHNNKISKQEFLQIMYLSQPTLKYKSMEKGNAISQVAQNIQYFAKKNNFTLKEVFDHFDRNHNDFLNLSEFERMLQNVDANLSEKEKKDCFDLFDENNIGKIGFVEFKKVIQKYSFEQQSYSAPSFKIIEEGAYKKNKNFEDLFDCFDSKKRNFLDFYEFSNLLDYLNLNLSEKQIRELFDLFDSNNIGKITRKAFLDKFKKQVQSFNMKKMDFSKLCAFIQEYAFSKHKNLGQIFDSIDLNRNSFIEKKEFKIFLADIGLEIDENDVIDYFYEFDKNRTGKITRSEFLSAFSNFSFRQPQATGYTFLFFKLFI